MAHPGNPSGEHQSDQAYSYPDSNGGSAFPPPSAEPTQAVSPAYGLPAQTASPGYGQPAQPVSPAYGPPAQPINPTYMQPVSPAYGPPAQPISPAYGPPSQPISPAYGQPVPPQPVPTHDQGTAFTAGTAQLPTYGEPTSGYAYGAENPMSGVPMSPSPMMGPPLPYGMQPQPPKKRGVAVPILASLLALAVIAAGVFVGLYIDKSGKLSKSQKLAAERQSTINLTSAELDKTKKDLQSTSDDLTKAQQDLRGTQADNTETKRQRDVIAKCLQLTYEALATTTKAALDAKVKELKAPCDEANKLVGL